MGRIAVLIDGENVQARHFAEIDRRCRALGDLRSRQVFADFSNNHGTAWLEICRASSLRPEFQLGRKGKNSVDIAITIAAMDLLANGSADTICLVSSDRDFIPLAQRLRRSGVQVIGIGLTTDKSLAESCDQYFTLDATAPKPPPVVAPKAKSVASPKTISNDEAAFIADMIRELCSANSSAPVPHTIIGKELRKRDEALWTRIGGKHLMKRLATAKIISIHGSGSTKLIAPAVAS